MAGETGEWPKTAESCKEKQNKARSNAAALSSLNSAVSHLRMPSGPALPSLV